MVRDSRGVSPVVSTVLMVAIVVVLAVTISAYVFGFAGNVQGPAPRVGQASGEFVPQDGTAGGIVQITHIAGESVAVSDLEIAVRADCRSGTKEGRIVDLPAGDGNDISEADGQIEGDNIFDERSLKAIDNEVDGVDDGGALLGNEKYGPGDVIIFRLPSSKCDLARGSRVSVRVVHVPSRAVIIDRDLTA